MMPILFITLGGPIVSSNWSETSKETLIKYILDGRNSHNLYCLRFTFCEILNFINVVCI